MSLSTRYKQPYPQQTEHVNYLLVATETLLCYFQGVGHHEIQTAILSVRKAGLVGILSDNFQRRN